MYVLLEPENIPKLVYAPTTEKLIHSECVPISKNVNTYPKSHPILNLYLSMKLYLSVKMNLILKKYPLLVI